MNAEPRPNEELVARALEEYFAAYSMGDKHPIPEFAGRYPQEIRGEFIWQAELMTSMRREPPTLEQFELHAQLGAGASGAVWIATQKGVERKCALKLLHPGLTLSDRVLERFRRESRAVGLLARHPGIVQVYEAGEDSGVHYIAMELIQDGHTLSREIARRHRDQRLDAERMFQVVQQIADVARALHAAHEKRVIHRDVKPQNILLTPQGEAKLSDFGLAKLLDAAATGTEDGLGTPYYMAPEQVDGDRGEIGPWTDVWGLGATLYEALTLHRPFPGDVRATVSRRILDDDPADPRLHASAIPADLAAIVLHCLEGSPARRYQSAEELALDLEAFEVGEPVSVRVPGITRRVSSWIRRHRVASWVLAIGALTTLGVVASHLRTVEANNRTELALSIYEGGFAALHAPGTTPQQAAGMLGLTVKQARDLFSEHPDQLAQILDDCAEVAAQYGLIENRVHLLRDAVNVGGEPAPRVQRLAEALLITELPAEARDLLEGRTEPELQELMLDALLSLRDAPGLTVWEEANGPAMNLLRDQMFKAKADWGEGSLQFASTNLTIGQLHMLRGNLGGALRMLNRAFYGISREHADEPLVAIHLQRASYALARLSVLTQQRLEAIERLYVAHSQREERWGASDPRTLRVLLDIGWAEMINDPRTLSPAIEQVVSLSDDRRFNQEADLAKALFEPDKDIHPGERHHERVRYYLGILNDR